jgi:site-specific DNA-methyltransferase (adenine-specific)
LTSCVVVSDALELWTGDAHEVLPRMEAGSADAVVTSPPYADARLDVEGPPLDSFADWFEPVLAELLRVLSPSGSLMLNLGRRFRDGEEHPFHEDTLARARGLGWRRIDTLVWHKTNGNSKGGPYLHDVHELVYWLAPSVAAYRGFTAETRAPYALSTVPRMGRAARSRVKGEPARAKVPPHPDGARPKSLIAAPTGQDRGNEHPTPMTPRVARYLVPLACPPGGLVLDPFCGSGNVLRAAIASGRRAVGVDLEEKWIRLTAERCAAVQLEAIT